MRPKLWLISMLTLSFVISGCAPAGEPVALLDEAAVAVEVKRASDASHAALIAGDIDTYLSYYMDDAVWLPPEAEEIVGKELAKARLAGLFDELTVEGRSIIEEQNVMSPNWVSIRGQFSMALTPKCDGGKTVYQVGSFVNIWKKDADGKWKIDLDIWNSDRGLPAADEAMGK